MKDAILFLEQQTWPGGAQRVLETTIACLSDMLAPIVAFPGEGVFRQEIRKRGVDTMTLPIGIYESGAKSSPAKAMLVVRSIVCALKLRSVIRRRRIVLIYVNGPRCILAGAIAAVLTGIPCVFHLHLILTRKYETVLVRLLARYLTAVIVCSEAAAEPLFRLGSSFRKKTRVIYNPVLERAGTPAPASIRKDPDAITFGIVGRITRAKGHHRLFGAVARMTESDRNRVQLVIVGVPSPDGSRDMAYAENLRALATRSGFAENVFWCGYQQDPRPYYDLMDALVLPSSSEALGLVALEALQRHVPVIASRTGGLIEVVRDGVNGLLVPPQDDAAWTEAIARFVTDVHLRGRLRAGTRSGLDERFSFLTYKGSVRNLIRAVCDRTFPSDSDSFRTASASQQSL